MTRRLALKLRPISNPKGDRNQYCGPAVISSLTGMGTGEAARLLRTVSGKTSIKGTHDSYLFRALSRCGVLVVERFIFPTRKLTLAGWLRETAGKRGGKVFLVSAGNHYQLVSGNRFVCGQVKDIVDLEHPGVHRRARVRAVWVLDAKAGTTIPAEARKPKPKLDPARKVRPGAKALAAKWGVEIERHTDLDSKPWFVSHPALEDEADDPWTGDHYVHAWDEVLERVQDYVEALQAKGIGPVA